MSEKNRHLTEFIVYSRTLLLRHFLKNTNVSTRNNGRIEAPRSLCPRKFGPVREKSVVRTEVMTVHTGKLTGHIQSNYPCIGFEFRAVQNLVAGPQ